MESPEKIFTNYHSHRLFDNTGDPNKFSMLPLKELEALLLAERANVDEKLHLVFLLEDSGALVDPIYITSALRCPERPAIDWLREVLKDSRTYKEAAEERGYKMVRSKLSKDIKEYLADKYNTSVSEELDFIKELKEKGLIK